MPNFVHYPKPGDDGIIAWKSLLENENSIAILLLSAVHLLPLQTNKDFTRDAELLATLTVSGGSLIVRNDSVIKNIKDLGKSQYTIGGVGEKGLCSTVLNGLSKKYNFNYIYVPYKLNSGTRIDLLTGRIDVHCAIGVNAKEYIINGDGREIFNLSDSYGFKVRTYIFANKNLPVNTKNLVLEQLKKKLSDEEGKLLTQLSIELDINILDKANEIFKTERNFWLKYYDN